MRSRRKSTCRSRKRKPGRPKGSKNRCKSPRRKSRSRRKPGRPKGSRNKRKSPRRKSRSRRKPGRPKGSKNRCKSPRRKSRSRRKPGRPKGSKNRCKSPRRKSTRKPRRKSRSRRKPIKKYSINSYSPEEDDARRHLSRRVRETPAHYNRRVATYVAEVAARRHLSRRVRETPAHYNRRVTAYVAAIMAEEEECDYDCTGPADLTRVAKSVECEVEPKCGIISMSKIDSGHGICLNNKCYNVDNLAAWKAQKRRQRQPFTNPSNRQPINDPDNLIPEPVILAPVILADDSDSDSDSSDSDDDDYYDPARIARRRRRIP